MRSLPSARVVLAGVLASCLVLAGGGRAAAEAEAVVVPLRLPLVGTRDTQAEGAIVRALERLRGAAGQRGLLVLRFEAAEGEPAAGSDFGRALSLARFLSSQRVAGRSSG